jgi:hypothetical protein
VVVRNTHATTCCLSVCLSKKSSNTIELYTHAASSSSWRCLNFSCSCLTCRYRSCISSSALGFIPDLRPPLIGPTSSPTHPRNSKSTSHIRSDLQIFLSRPDVHCTKATAALFLKYIYRLDEGPLAPRTCNTTLSFDLLKGIHRTPLYVCKVGMFFTLFHLMSIPYQCTPLLIII